MICSVLRGIRTVEKLVAHEVAHREAKCSEMLVGEGIAGISSAKVRSSDEAASAQSSSPLRLQHRGVHCAGSSTSKLAACQACRVPAERCVGIIGLLVPEVPAAVPRQR
jgi:hypothetical protein